MADHDVLSADAVRAIRDYGFASSGDVRALCDSVDQLRGERDEARRAHEQRVRDTADLRADLAEARRVLALRQIEVDALGSQLLDVQQDCIAANKALTAIGELLKANGCDCACDHWYDEHDDDCERCLACRVNDALEGPKHAENVCEHGDHWAPDGARFCSAACQECEAAPCDHEVSECAGICQGKGPADVE